MHPTLQIFLNTINHHKNRTLKDMEKNTIRAYKVEITLAIQSGNNLIVRVKNPPSLFTILKGDLISCDGVSAKIIDIAHYGDSADVAVVGEAFPLICGNHFKAGSIITFHEMKKLNIDMENKFEWNDDKVEKLAHSVFYQRGHKPLKDFIDDFKKEYSRAEAMEVVEKKYPKGIISFRSGVDNSIGTFNDNLNYQKWCHVHLKCKPVSTIHSIKNSSGEILTVGDETEDGIIQKIWIESLDNEIIITTTNLQHRHFNNVHHKKKLMTEDGYDEKLGFWPVETDGFTMGGFHEDKPRNFDRNFYKTFHKKENAEKYIEENKPRFSKKELNDHLEALFMLSETEKQERFIQQLKTRIGL